MPMLDVKGKECILMILSTKTNKSTCGNSGCVISEREKNWWEEKKSKAVINCSLLEGFGAI